MKPTFLAVVLVAFSFSALAQNNPVPITGGRFLMQRGVENFTNARIETPNFTALSWVNAEADSAWNVCSGGSNPPFCTAGTTVNVPRFPNVRIGYCITCNPPQFPRGTFTLNATTYENVYFKGEFQFSQTSVTVFPMFLAKRKGLVRLTKPFTMTGNLQVCRTVNDPDCPPGDVIYNTQIAGKETLTYTTRVVTNFSGMERPFLLSESFEYQFE